MSVLSDIASSYGLLGAIEIAVLVWLVLGTRRRPQRLVDDAERLGLRGPRARI
jgi:hypothetical protein